MDVKIARAVVYHADTRLKKLLFILSVRLIDVANWFHPMLIVTLAVENVSVHVNIDVIQTCIAPPEMKADR